MSELNDWPTNGAGFNVWYKELHAMVSVINSNNKMWLINPKLKYLNIRIDTRRGDFVIFDRDRNAVDPNEIREAVREAAKRFG